MASTASGRPDTTFTGPRFGTERVEQLLAGCAEGNRTSFDDLFSAVYGELRAAAHRHLRRSPAGETLNTTALVHESYLKLAAANHQSWRDRAQFFAIASTTMRHILVDYARMRSARKRGGDVLHITFGDETGRVEAEAVSLLALDEALGRLKQLDPRLERVVEHRFFGGLDVRDTAEALGVSERTVQRDWKRAKTYLYHILKPAASST